MGELDQQTQAVTKGTETAAADAPLLPPRRRAGTSPLGPSLATPLSQSAAPGYRAD